ncbi:MAG: serine/threonine-protein kinase [Hyphomicrobiaceae bacterium]
MAYQQTLPVGTELIEDFRILGLLGSGGFANTYLAMDLTLGREVAIKEYFPSELAIRASGERVEVKTKSHEPQFEWALKRFVREAKTLAKFRHPSVVRVFRVFNANETAYIVLEFVRGSNMETWLKGLGRRPTQEEFDTLLPPLLDALEVVHSAGILHRDIKPANIYIRASDQTPVLLDFGAARYAQGDYAGTTAAIVSKGYSPHEAYATDSRLQGPWTDIYGLAATAYRALTGSAPPESTTRVLEDNCVPVAVMEEFTSEYRPDFLLAVDHALRIMPKERPQSIGAWRRMLLPDSSSMPRVLDANGDPTTIKEWRPISDVQSDSPSSDRPFSGGSGGTLPDQLGRDSRSRSAVVVGRSRPLGNIVVPAGDTGATGLTGNGTTRLMDSYGQPASGDVSSGSGARPRSDSGRAVNSAIVNRTSEPVRSRTLLIGVAFLMAGTAALTGQWLLTRDGDHEPPGVSIETPGPYIPSRAAADEERRRAQAAAKAAEEQRQRDVAAAEERRRAQEAADAKAAEEQRQRELAAAEERRKEREAAAAKAAEEKRERELAAAEERRKEREAAAAKAAEEKRERELAAAEERRKEQEAAAAKAAEEKRRELAAAEERRKEREAAAAKAAEEKRERELAAAEERRKEQEAAAAKAAEEKRERELAAADEKRRRELAAAEERRKEQDAAAKAAAEEAAAAKAAEEKRQRELAAADERRKAEAERAAAEKRKQELASASQTGASGASTEVGSRSASDGLAGRRIAPLTGDLPQDESGRRAVYIKRMQAALMTSQCYSGELDGDADTTSAALTSFETSFRGEGEPQKIDVASASAGEFETWLNWFYRQESFSCRGAAPVPERPSYRRGIYKRPAVARPSKPAPARPTYTHRAPAPSKPVYKAKPAPRPSKPSYASRPSKPS